MFRYYWAHGVTRPIAGAELSHKDDLHRWLAYRFFRHFSAV